MKVHKMINLDIEVLQELSKEKNCSALINSYLINYYGLGTPSKQLSTKPAEELPEDELELDKEEAEALK